MQGEEQFNDDALKQAVCSAWADECCPGELHNKLKHVCACASQKSRWTGHAIRALAMAAAVLLAVLVWPRHAGSPSASQQPARPMLVADLVRTHDVCSHSKDHQHVNAALDDDTAIARALSSALHQAVLVARPASPGWTFRGAAVCPVGNVPAAHLVFVNGSDTLSIFSLPGTAMSGAHTGSVLKDIDAEHHVVAFEKDGGLFCLVGSGPGGEVSSASLIKMRDAMQDAVTMPNAVARSADDDLMFAMR